MSFDYLIVAIPTERTGFIFHKTIQNIQLCFKGKERRDIEARKQLKKIMT